MLVDQIRSLLQNNIILSAVDFKKVAVINQDILCNGEKIKRILTEHQIAEECQRAPNINNLCIYNRNLIYAFHMAGFSLQQTQHYLDAIEIYNKALTTTQAIPTHLRNFQDTDVSNCCHRDIAMCENLFANNICANNQILESIHHYKLAIGELNKIPNSFVNDWDAESISIYKHNFAVALNIRGNHFFEQKDFTEAITHYDSAEQLIAEIQAESRLESDLAAECIYRLNKQVAQFNKDMNGLATNRNGFFNRSSSAPDLIEQKSNNKKRKRLR